jgi:hypothetical protein
VASQYDATLSLREYIALPVSFGHRYSVMPTSQKANTPSITRCAWPGTQSEKWMSFWRVSVVWNAHWKHVMK